MATLTRLEQAEAAVAAALAIVELSRTVTPPRPPEAFRIAAEHLDHAKAALERGDRPGQPQRIHDWHVDQVLANAATAIAAAWGEPHVLTDRRIRCEV